MNKHIKVINFNNNKNNSVNTNSTNTTSNNDNSIYNNDTDSNISNSINKLIKKYRSNNKTKKLQNSINITDILQKNIKNKLCKKKEYFINKNLDKYTNINHKYTNLNDKSTNINDKSRNLNDKSTNINDKSTNINDKSKNLNNKSTNLNDKSINLSDKSTNINQSRIDKLNYSLSKVINYNSKLNSLDIIIDKIYLKKQATLNIETKNNILENNSKILNIYTIIPKSLHSISLLINHNKNIKYNLTLLKKNITINYL